MMKWLEKILNYFHLYTQSQVNQKLAQNTEYYDCEIRALRESAEQTANGLKTIIEAHETLQHRYDEVVDALRERNTMVANLQKVKENLDKQLVLANDRLSEMMRIDKVRIDEVARYKEAALVNIDYVKDVQKQLSEAFRNSDAFGFPNKVAMPGSTSICTDLIEDQTDGTIVTVRGRSVLTDDVTQKINDTPDMIGRLDLVFNHMERYGILATVAKTLIRSGAIAFTLAYNDKCTSYEVYYECSAKRQDASTLLVIDDQTCRKTDVEG